MEALFPAANSTSSIPSAPTKLSLNTVRDCIHSFIFFNSIPH